MTAEIQWVILAGGKGITHRAKYGEANTYCGKAIRDGAIWTNKPKTECRDCIAADPRRAEFIERSLNYLLMMAVVKTETGRRINPWAFDGAQPWFRDACCWQEEVLGDDPCIPFDIKPHECPVLDVRLIGDDLDRPGQVVLSRIRRVAAKQVRGQVSLFLPYPTLVTVCFPSDGFAADYIYGWANRWMLISAHYKPSKWKDEIYHEQIQLAAGLTKTNEKTWRVYFALDDRPGIEFPTSAVGAQEAFRLRDIPDGKARRAALRHWVTEHWRINVADASEEFLVREHLRGVTEFNWSGLRCRITPSAVDLDRLDEAREAREQAKRDGTDRRTLVS